MNIEGIKTKKNIWYSVLIFGLFYPQLVVLANEKGEVGNVAEIEYYQESGPIVPTPKPKPNPTPKPKPIIKLPQTGGHSTSLMSWVGLTILGVSVVLVKRRGNKNA